jgi:N-methylhydantoinase B
VAEQQYPMLILYRREVRGGGGNGRWRGGDGIELAWVAHGVDALQLESMSSANVIPSSPGLFGGLPGSPGWHYMVKDSEIQESLRTRLFPGDPSELRQLAGSHLDVPPKTREIRQDRDAVWEMRCMSGGGYGDPLRREAKQVADDVRNKVVSKDTAHDTYGVVVDSIENLDVTGTQKLRQQMIESRLATSNVHKELPSVAERFEAEKSSNWHEGPFIHEYLRLRAQDGNWWIACECGQILCRAEENYQEYSAVHIGRTDEIGPLFEDPSKQVDADMVSRQFYCPACAVMFEAEVVQRDDPLTWDIQIVVGDQS